MNPDTSDNAEQLSADAASDPPESSPAAAPETDAAPEADAAPETAEATDADSAVEAAEESEVEGVDSTEVTDSSEEAEASEAPAPPPPAVETNPTTPASEDDDAKMDWYILKVAFNREDSIADALRKRVKMEGMAEFFGDIVVPTEDVANFTRDGKRRISKRKLLPGYIMVNMIINDDTWFLVRETNGISDFTGAAGKPMPMEPSDIDRFITRPHEDEEEEAPIKIGIPFKVHDRVRVKEGNFENQEGEVDAVDEANGRVTVIINIFGRSVPMELDHWQVEPL